MAEQTVLKIASPVKLGFCQCGCGKRTPICKWSDAKRGYVRGQPKRFVRGHGFIGRGALTKENIGNYVTVDGSTGCWNWKGAKTRGGYGCKPSPSVNEYMVHRIVFVLFNGPIPDGLLGLHRCDNPPCCNPAHIFLGTQADNIADCANKNRLCCGERQHTSKLNPNSVREIRELFRAGETKAALARKYGVSDHAILNVVRRITWKGAA